MKLLYHAGTVCFLNSLPFGAGGGHKPRNLSILGTGGHVKATENTKWSWIQA